MILPPRFIVLAILIVLSAGLGLPMEIEGHPLIGLIGLAAGTAGFIALNLVGYAIERRKPKTSNSAISGACGNGRFFWISGRSK
jgi:multisubunit Na+/H+ antiporter MnhB subunit